MQTVEPQPLAEVQDPGAIRILLASDDMAVRLTLEAVLSKSGYCVESAASAAEAVERIENGQYALILCGFGCEDASVCRDVLRFARGQDYRPATAYLTASELPGQQLQELRDSEHLLVETVEVPALLAQVAELVANRAADRALRTARRNASSSS